MLNKLAAIIRKDTTLRFEGRSELLFFLILPIIFTYLIGGGFADMGDNRTNVPVVNEDGGARAEAFLAALAASDTIEPPWSSSPPASAPACRPTKSWPARRARSC